MKKILFLAIALMTCSVIFAQEKTAADTTAKAVYTCTMHPEIRADKPGKCPKCGMDLVLVQDKTFSCPMHPEVTASKPGKCPKCGMALVKGKTFTCPMHAGEMSHKAGKCPKCGMAMVEKKP